MNKEQLRMQMLAGVITESEYTAVINKEIEEEDKSSLNESMIGGIVGIGAINQIPATPKTDYEMAFDHFLGERYEVKPNKERDDIKEDETSDMEDEVEAEVAMNEEDENTVDLGEMATQISAAFDSIEDMPLDPSSKLQMAKVGLGMSILNALGEKMKQGGDPTFSKPDSQEKFQTFISDIKNATSVEEVKQTLLNVIQLANS
jgi:hypothetical protein